MTPLLRWPSRFAAYLLVCALDHSVWLLIQTVPGPQMLQLARRRPRTGSTPERKTAAQRIWQARIAWLLRLRCRRAGWGSSCLSRSLTGRLLLDGIGVANTLHLGMSKEGDGRKVPHAWLSDPHSGRCYTPGLAVGAGVPLMQL